MKLKMTSCCLTLATLLAAQPALAQEEPAGGGLEEIVVTAQKRSESLQDVPATVSVLSADALETRQIDDLSDVSRQVPSFVVGKLFGSNLVTLRGISTGLTSGTEDPSVAVHVNGVYQPRTRGLDVILADVDQVEILAGPQGTLYGRNATGGVVNYTLAAPSREFEAGFSGLAANYDRYSVKGYVSGPLGDQVQIRISGLYDDQQDGFTKNLLPNAPKSSLEDNRVVGGRFAAAIQPSESVNLQLETTYADTKSSTYFATFAQSEDPFYRALYVPVTTTPHRTFSDLDGKLDSTIVTATFTAEFELANNVTLKSISGYQDYEDYMAIDADGSGYLGVNTNQSVEAKTYTQEVNLNVALFDDRLKSIYGFFYFDDRITLDNFVEFGGFIPNVVIPIIYYTDQKAKSWAVYTDQTLAITDSLRLRAGLRYSKDRKSVDQLQNFAGAVCTFRDRYSDDQFSPLLALQYDFTPDVMGYVQWQKGYKSGGFVHNSCGDDYGPEKVTGYETGLKSTLFDNKVRLNLSAFYYDFRDIQVQQYQGILLQVANAAKARIYGAEASLEWLVSDAFRLDLAGNIQSAKYREFVNCNSTVSTVACTAADPRPPAVQQESFAGNWLNRAPPYTLNLGAQYRFDFANGATLTARGEAYLSGKMHFDEFASPEVTQGAYRLLNAYLTYEAPSEAYQVRLFGKNLANETYKVSGFNLGASGLAFVGNYGPPRTYGVEIAFKFR